MDTSFTINNSENFFIRIVSNMTKITPSELTKSHGIIGIQNIFVSQVKKAKDENKLNEVMSILSNSYDQHSFENLDAKQNEIVELQKLIAKLQGEVTNNPTEQEVRSDKKALDLIAYVGLLIIGFVGGSIFGLSI